MKSGIVLILNIALISFACGKGTLPYYEEALAQCIAANCPAAVYPPSKCKTTRDELIVTPPSQTCLDVTAAIMLHCGSKTCRLANPETEAQKCAEQYESYRAEACADPTD